MFRGFFFEGGLKAFLGVRVVVFQDFGRDDLVAPLTFTDTVWGLESSLKKPQALEPRLQQAF